MTKEDNMNEKMLDVLWAIVVVLAVFVGATLALGLVVGGYMLLGPTNFNVAMVVVFVAIGVVFVYRRRRDDRAEKERQARWSAKVKADDAAHGQRMANITRAPWSDGAGNVYQPEPEVTE